MGRDWIFQHVLMLSSPIPGLCIRIEAACLKVHHRILEQNKRHHKSKKSIEILDLCCCPFHMLHSLKIGSFALHPIDPHWWPLGGLSKFVGQVSYVHKLCMSTQNQQSYLNIAVNGPAWNYVPQAEKVTPTSPIRCDRKHRTFKTSQSKTSSKHQVFHMFHPT